MMLLPFGGYDSPEGLLQICPPFCLTSFIPMSRRFYSKGLGIFLAAAEERKRRRYSTSLTFYDPLDFRIS